MASPTDTQQTLEEVASGKLTVEDALKQLSSGSRPPRAPRVPHFSVTKNGAVALYNVQRRPVVLFADQWETLFPLQGEYQKFVSETEVKRR